MPSPSGLNALGGLKIPQSVSGFSNKNLICFVVSEKNGQLLSVTLNVRLYAFGEKSSCKNSHVGLHISLLVT